MQLLGLFDALVNHCSKVLRTGGLLNACMFRLIISTQQKLPNNHGFCCTMAAEKALDMCIIRLQNST